MRTAATMYGLPVEGSPKEAYCGLLWLTVLQLFWCGCPVEVVLGFRGAITQTDKHTDTTPTHTQTDGHTSSRVELTPQKSSLEMLFVCPLSGRFLET